MTIKRWTFHPFWRAQVRRTNSSAVVGYVSWQSGACGAVGRYAACKKAGDATRFLSEASAIEASKTVALLPGYYITTRMIP